ncbi:carboxypeptidase-like regulatory domain-containing protein [Bacteroides thetaiotaomicron]|nr:carboxypeptidase-like regulatory domain-containing protein [Bacteroides thetaiotaomicron]
MFQAIYGDKKQKREIIVKGVVEDDLGPIIGASVVAKNQAGVGVITNTEGKFSLKVGPYDVLVVTFVGYQPYELPVLKMNDPNNVTIKLLEDVGKIDEVVITASGLQQKKTLTGAITNVDVKQLNAVGSSSLSNSLAGVVPGIIAMQSVVVNRVKIHLNSGFEVLVPLVQNQEP